MKRKIGFLRFVKLFLGVFVILFSTTQLSAYFVSYISHSPEILLLGDNHDISHLNGHQISGLFSKLNSKSKRCTVLVEDPCVMIPYGNWNGVLSGMIKRINSKEVDNPNIQTICLERNLEIYTTSAFFNCATFPPFDGLYSPDDLRLNNIKNSYEYTFSDFLNSVDNQVEILKKIRTEFNANYDICVFIDFMTLSIEDAADKLKSRLEKFNINQNQSVLRVAVQTKLAERIILRPKLINEIVRFSLDLDIFMHDYLVGLTGEEWSSRALRLGNQKSVIFGTIGGLMNTMDAGYLTRAKEYFYSLSLIKYCFKEWELRKEDLISKVNAFKELEEQILNLRLHCFDAFAVLDILKYCKDGEVLVCAGDLHIQNISNYLECLDHPVLAKPTFEYGFVPPNYF